MKRYHIAHEYLHLPNNKITVNLVGAGGTGSHMLSSLASLNHTLRALDRIPLMVNVFDYKDVSQANLGRQLFSKSELGMNKAIAMTDRINKFFGIKWNAYPIKYEKNNKENYNIGANIIITCTDNIKSRFAIRDAFPNKKEDHRYNATTRPLYWLDIGNDRYTGQVVLGSLEPSTFRHKGHKRMIPTFAEMYPELRGKRDRQSPSCSTLESIEKQDLFINKILATLAADLLWNLLYQHQINFQGYYVNLTTGKINPIPIQ